MARSVIQRLDRWKRSVWSVACMAVMALEIAGPTIAARPSPRPSIVTPLTRYSYAEVVMGLPTRLTVYAPSEAVAKDACRAAFRRLAALEDIMSDYRPTSELMRLCDRAGGPPVRVSPELWFVLDRGLTLSRQSHGAFDVTLGPLVQLWRTARRSGQLPDARLVREAQAKVGWRKVVLNRTARTARLTTPGMRLDLGGIAKGYAGDEAIRALRAHGVRRALFASGGDIVAGDAPPGKRGWQVEVANVAPSLERGHRAWRTLYLRNGALSSSGDTEQFVVIGGRRYSHIVDPRTGAGLTDRIAVTVKAPHGVLSDSLSTTLSVLGPKRGRALLKRYPGVSAYFRRAPG